MIKYVLVEWPESQEYMESDDCLYIQDSQDVMVPLEIYKNKWN